MNRRWIGTVLGLCLVAATAMAGAPVRPPAGKAAPPFSLTLFSGREVTLTELQGKAVVIDFWHSG